MGENITPEVGRRVCVVGHGTAIGMHEHPTVTRVTKTLLATDNGRRFRRKDGYSAPRGAYGGTTVSTTCQKPKEDS